MIDTDRSIVMDQLERYGNPPSHSNPSLDHSPSRVPGRMDTYSGLAWSTAACVDASVEVWNEGFGSGRIREPEEGDSVLGWRGCVTWW